MNKNIQDLIDYLEDIKDIVGAKAKILVDGEAIIDFEESIFVDKSKCEIDFVSDGFL